MLTEDRLYQAMKMLAETDELAAELKTDVNRKKFILDRVKATIQIYSEGAQELRKAHALVSPETEKAENEYLNSVNEFEKLANKRKTEELVVDIWRTESANRRVGNVS